MPGNNLIPLILAICFGILVFTFGGLFLRFKLNSWLRKHNYRPLQSLRVRLGRGKSLNHLAQRLKIAPEELINFQPRYTLKRIPKRSGGMRTLHIPDADTKALQRKVLRFLFAKLRAHPACHGFERGRSIATNAAAHVGRAVIIKIDIRDFFPRTTPARLDHYFRRIGWNKEAAALLVRLTTHEGGLPQGAPTSPRLSNLVNYALDARLTSFARYRKCTYTRYADDITFSCPKDYPSRVRGIIQRTRAVLKSCGYQINTKKIVIARHHQQQRVTGIIVNDTLNLPRKTRRFLRSVAYRLATGKTATLTPQQIKGYLAYELMIKAKRRGKT